MAELLPPEQVIIVRFKGKRETKSLAVGLSNTVAVTVLPEALMLIFMLWMSSEEAGGTQAQRHAQGDDEHRKTRSPGLGLRISQLLHLFTSRDLVLSLMLVTIQGFRSRKKPPVGPSSGNVA